MTERGVQTDNIRFACRNTRRNPASQTLKLSGAERKLNSKLLTLKVTVYRAPGSMRNCPPLADRDDTLHMEYDVILLQVSMMRPSSTARGGRIGRSGAERPYRTPLAFQGARLDVSGDIITGPVHEAVAITYSLGFELPHRDASYKASEDKRARHEKLQ